MIVGSIVGRLCRVGLLAVPFFIIVGCGGRPPEVPTAPVMKTIYFVCDPSVPSRVVLASDGKVPCVYGTPTALPYHETVPSSQRPKVVVQLSHMTIVDQKGILHYVGGGKKEFVVDALMGASLHLRSSAGHVFWEVPLQGLSLGKVLVLYLPEIEVAQETWACLSKEGDCTVTLNSGQWRVRE